MKGEKLRRNVKGNVFVVYFKFYFDLEIYFPVSTF